MSYLSQCLPSSERQHTGLSPSMFANIVDLGSGNSNCNSFALQETHPVFLLACSAYLNDVVLQKSRQPLIFTDDPCILFMSAVTVAPPTRHTILNAAFRASAYYIIQPNLTCRDSHVSMLVLQAKWKKKQGKTDLRIPQCCGINQFNKQHYKKYWFVLFSSSQDSY